MNYGPILKTDKAEKFAMHIFKVSRQEKEQGRKGIPVCAWGEAGIGKTELPNLLVKKYPDFFGKLVYLPMAQIEEKAELQGLPDLKTLVRDLLPGEDESNVVGIIEEVEDKLYAIDEEGNIKMDANGFPVFKIVKKKVVVDNRTVYATPSWIPQESTHGKYGLLVIDDMNRADARIINSIMQLLQDGKLLGWSLPIGWEIYCTCNPDNGVYQVTTFDGAQMTRMANFEQKFDALSWVQDWAMPTGLHSIAQNFGLTHPETVIGGSAEGSERTNPRSFDKFFRVCHEFFDNPDAHVEEIRAYGMMNVDALALSTFIAFITDGFGRLPNVEDILNGTVDLDELESKLKQSGTLRVDVINSLSCRLIFHIQANNITKEQIPNYRKWLKHKMLPAEIRFKDAKVSLATNFDISDVELGKIILSQGIS